MNYPKFTNNLKRFPEIYLTSKTTDNGRFYTTPEGNIYPSVTTVLGRIPDDGIEEWKMRVGEDEARKVSHWATDRGSNVHLFCEDLLSNKIKKDIDDISYTRMDPIEYRQCKQFYNMLPKAINTVYGLEVALYSDKYKIAGRIDCIADFLKKLSIVDFKTSKKKKKKEWIESYYYQTMIYALMFEERYNTKIEQNVICISNASEPKGPQIFLGNPEKWRNKTIELLKVYN